MEYDRVQVKRAAKAAVHRGDPRPWLVTLVYFLLSFVPSGLFALVISLPSSLLSTFPHYGGRYGGHGGFRSLLILFFYIFIYLFTAVLTMGYRRYSMNLWRGRRTEVKDLFHGFPMAGKVIPLFLFVALFSFLWSLACLPVFLPVVMLSFFSYSEGLFTLLFLLAYAGYLALLANRLLRYTLCFYVLLDHPDWGVRDCLNESKHLMAGRRWSLCVLNLSFLGWYLLVALIYLAVMAVAIVGVVLMITAGSTASESVGLFFLSLLFGPLLFLAIIFASYLLSLPLLLWLTPYVSVSTAGFYECAAGIPPSPPGPAFYCGGPAPSAPPPPPAWTSYAPPGLRSQTEPGDPSPAGQDPEETPAPPDNDCKL